MSTQNKSIETLKVEFSKLLAPLDIDYAKKMMTAYIDFYNDISDFLPEGALKQLFKKYSWYQPEEDTVRIFWAFYEAMWKECKEKPSWKNPSTYAALFMWATRATWLMEA